MPANRNQPTSPPDHAQDHTISDDPAGEDSILKVDVSGLCRSSRLRHRAEAVPFAVGLYITAAYWFTASTSFANPAVTIARTLSGIRPVDAPLLIICQIVCALLATWTMVWLLSERSAQHTAVTRASCPAPPSNVE